MTVYFHQSLPLLVTVAQGRGVKFEEGTVVVRDGFGRLTLASETISDTENLGQALRDTVGAYVSPTGVLNGPQAARLLSDPGIRTVTVDLLMGTVSIKLIDRRIVGTDWLRAPTASMSATKRIVFGSLKGGVGRSTALVVLAAELARQGKRVLTIDLDLEAPGIGTMLLEASDDQALDRRPKYGVVDYLVENGLNGIPDEEMYDFIGVSPFHQGSIDVLPAIGRETDIRPELMIAKLSRALVEDNRPSGPVPVVTQLQEMVHRFELRGNYDVTLIDARAGMAEITAAPLLGLGAEVLFFGADQPQTFQGYAFILAHLIAMSDRDALGGADDWRQRLTFVQSKASASSKKRQLFRERLYELCSEFLYDQETLDSVPSPFDLFAPSPNEEGPGVPHDSSYIEFHPDYDAFDPLADLTQLDNDVYQGPFGSFLSRMGVLISAEKVTLNE